MPAAIKICGITTESALHICVKMHVDIIGCVFYDLSSRNVSLERAGLFANIIPDSIKKAAVFVNPDFHLIKQVVKTFQPDYIQLDGNETPEILSQIKRQFSIPIIKTLYVAGAAEVGKWQEYEAVADYILFDSIQNNDLFIENSDNIFDWGVIKEHDITIPWILSGGLNKYNVLQAIRTSAAKIVNASSTMEITPGVKDVLLLESFIKTIRQNALS